MALALFPLIGYLASAAYLVSWLFNQAWRLYRIGSEWRFQRQMAGKVLSLRPQSQKGVLAGYLVSLSGVFFGIAFALLAVQWVYREWLMLILVVLAIISEELRLGDKENTLLGVIVLFDRLQFHLQFDVDLFLGLGKVLDELPDGEVKQAAREAVLRRRSGVAEEDCLPVLERIDPYLDEFVLTAKNLNYKTGTPLEIALQRLSHWAGRAWHRESRLLLVKNRTRPYFRFGQSAILAALFVLVLGGLNGLLTAWPNHQIFLLVGLTIAASALALTLIVITTWSRRIMALTLFLISLTPFVWNQVIVLPTWVQMKTVTYAEDRFVNELNRQDKSETFPPVDVHNRPARFSIDPFQEDQTAVLSDFPTQTPIPTIVTRHFQSSFEFDNEEEECNKQASQSK